MDSYKELISILEYLSKVIAEYIHGYHECDATYDTVKLSLLQVILKS